MYCWNVWLWYTRLHREALKQAAIDPSTGKIDVSILTTGVSGAVRKMRAERANMLREILRGKGKVVVIKNAKLLEEYREKMTEKGEPVSGEIITQPAQRFPDINYGVCYV